MSESTTGSGCLRLDASIIGTTSRRHILLRIERKTDLYGPSDREIARARHMIGRVVYYQVQDDERRFMQRILDCDRGELICITEDSYLVEVNEVPHGVSQVSQGVVRASWIGTVETTYWELV